ncbi:MAG: 16S rRNA (guanine(527)-N(7))-methyltransferase RsmG [Methylovirgula sp.]
MAKQLNKRNETTAEDDRAAALKLFPLSSETQARFDIYAALLRKWQKTINLVAASTLPQIWTRHFADSLQVQAALPEARIWADLGSGAGFPGLVTAIRLADVPGAKVHLIESDQRKCAFLRDVSRETQAPAEVHQGRIEDVLPTITDRIEAVSARALAPLPQLLGYSCELIKSGATGIFLKGEHLDDELTQSRALDYFDEYEIRLIRSVTAERGQILVVRQKNLGKSIR